MDNCIFGLSLYFHGRRYGTDPTRWKFPPGTKHEVYRLAVSNLLFTVVYNSVQTNVSLEDLFIHSTDFAIVDRRGRLRTVVHGEVPDAIPKILETSGRLVREH
jgi:cytochrome oxidase Cu insertion factor (SCO1/SenC/PrrC family)